MMRMGKTVAAMALHQLMRLKERVRAPVNKLPLLPAVDCLRTPYVIVAQPSIEDSPAISIRYLRVITLDDRVVVIKVDEDLKDALDSYAMISARHGNKSLLAVRIVYFRRRCIPEDRGVRENEPEFLLAYNILDPLEADLKKVQTLLEQEPENGNSSEP